MLTTADIANNLRHIQWFKGVYPINLLPYSLGQSEAIIINLDESWKDGSHWVALYIDNNRIAHYFDSFGREPKGPILTLIEKCADNYLFNPNKYQGNSSTACGYFCMLFVLSVQSLNEFYRVFSACKHEKNEKKLFNKLINYL